MGTDRWTLIQHLLAMVETVAREMLAADDSVAQVPDGVLFKDYGAGRVPVIRILGGTAGRELIVVLATEVGRLGLTGLQVQHHAQRMR
jgi:hypothetical protein